IISVENEPVALGVIHLDSGFRFAVDARRRHVHQDALTLLSREYVIINISWTVDNPIDDGINLDALGLLHVVVGFLLLDFLLIANAKRPRIADAPFVNEAHVVKSDWDAGINRDFEFRDNWLGRGQGRRLGSRLLWIGRWWRRRQHWFGPNAG